MSAVSSQARDAVALQLLAALEQYDADSGTMIAAWPDLERYRAVSDQVEMIRMYCSALPDVAVQWVELLIAHAELVHVLWRAQYGFARPAGSGPEQEGPEAQLAAVRERHADAIAALRGRCIRSMARPPAP